MDLKSGYKQTEVGVIPSDWEVRKVGDEFEIKLGKMLDAEKNVGIPKFYIGNRYVQWNRIDTNDLPIMLIPRSELERFRLCFGDLLVCEGGEVGRAAIWEEQIEECYYQKALHRLRPIRGFNTRLMLSILHYWSAHNKLADYVTQTSIAHLTREKFISIPLPIPPKVEQTAIATALSDTDQYITHLEKLIAKKRNIKQGAMQELLKPNEGWVVKKLGDIAEVTMGQSPLSEFYNTEGKGLPLIQGNADVDNRKTIIRAYTSSITKRGRVGDVIMSVRAPVGEISKATFDCCLGRGVCSIRFQNEYLYHYLIFFERSWTKFSTGSTFDSVNSTQVKQLDIPIPEKDDEQIRIATILSDIDSEIATLETKLAKAQSIKQGMMQQLLTGKIRLIN